ncbi:MAG: CoA transferase [Actinomycetota bacterium]|nr:CoA transferase [Actinomycetota bacterium]
MTPTSRSNRGGRRREAGAGPTALGHLTICDLSGQLAGAGATRYLAAFGARVIRVEDPVRQGRWDIIRGVMPHVDERRGIELGGGFNNHNVEKLGVTINLRSERGKDLLRRLVEVSDVVTENFAAGVMARMGFSYEDLRSIREDIIYVSNSGFGHSGPYSTYKTFGPVVQAACGLTFGVGAPDAAPAGWGFSYMDHMGANLMVVALLAAVAHRNRTGEGQWVDMSCTEAGLGLTGPDLLDYTVNDRPLRRPGRPDSNHSDQPPMAPHGIYPTCEEDRWVAIACRDDRDWAAFAGVCGEPWVAEPGYTTVAGRLAGEADIDRYVAGWTSGRSRRAVAGALSAAGVPAAAVALPEDRIDHDADSDAWGLYPLAHHPEIGSVRVDGVPAHLSETDWHIERGAPLLGQHNREVFCELIGLGEDEFSALAREGVF